MSQAMAFTVHLSDADVSISDGKDQNWRIFYLPRLCKVNRRPEKQTAAMQMKNANSLIMARRALGND